MELLGRDDESEEAKSRGGPFRDQIIFHRQISKLAQQGRWELVRSKDNIEVNTRAAGWKEELSQAIDSSLPLSSRKVEGWLRRTELTPSPPRSLPRSFKLIILHSLVGYHGDVCAWSEAREDP